MDKIEIYHYLKRQNIAYEITEHKAVFNMEEDLKKLIDEDERLFVFVKGQLLDVISRC